MQGRNGLDGMKGEKGQKGPDGPKVMFTTVLPYYILVYIVDRVK